MPRHDTLGQEKLGTVGLRRTGNHGSVYILGLGLPSPHPPSLPRSLGRQQGATRVLPGQAPLNQEAWAEPRVTFLTLPGLRDVAPKHQSPQTTSLGYSSSGPRRK